MTEIQTDLPKLSNSELTAGPELKLVDEDISSNFNGTAMRMGSSSVGRPESVLDNPNLSSTQVNELAKSFLQIGYNGNPENRIISKQQKKLVMFS